jgi:hypothetical protein
MLMATSVNLAVQQLIKQSCICISGFASVRLMILFPEVCLLISSHEQQFGFTKRLNL